MIRKAAAPLLVALLLAGCSSRPLINRFKFGMSKNEVTEILGKPMIPRGVTFNKFEQVVEVYEYDEGAAKEEAPKGTSDTTLGKPSSFYLFFYDGQLVQWGEADDWREVAKLLYETRFW